MSDGGPQPAGVREQFESLWEGLEGVDDLARTATLATVKHEMSRGAPPPADGLPRVDHLMAIGGVLGTGGTGEVVAAEQVSLGRTIAVKRRLRPETLDASDALLREARVIGFLEHPNIPPVHFVGSGSDGELLVGLKHIEGRTLEDALAERPGPAQLDDFLDTLINVSNAVAFAQERGILHLDLKPENVMTGAHGEVYVVDWGLAVAWRDDVASTIPRAPTDHRFRGTPAYAAPEMVRSDPPSPATDVWLLGGILHKVLTGEPPNRGSTAFEALMSAYSPPPREFPSDVPILLQEICRRALAPQPHDRFQDADAFRDALVEFRRERRQLESLEAATNAVEALTDVLRTDGAPSAVYQRFGATRQALDEAARLHADPQVSAPMLQTALEALVRWELDRGNVGSAELLLAELPSANEELAAECAELRSRQADERRELQALRLDRDASVGTTRKVALVVVLAVAICSLQALPFVFDFEATPQIVLTGYVCYLVILTLLSVQHRRTLFTTWTNRALFLSIWELSSFGFLIRVGAFLDVLSLHAAMAFDLTLVTVVSVVNALTLDRRLALVVPIYAVAAVAAFAWAELTMLTFGFAHLVGLTALALSMALLPAGEPIWSKPRFPD